MKHDYDDIIGTVLGCFLIVMLLASTVVTMCDEFNTFARLVSLLILSSVICVVSYITID